MVLVACEMEEKTHKKSGMEYRQKENLAISARLLVCPAIQEARERLPLSSSAE